ncbi:MAG: hypothetical protein C5B50_23385 [Verrucomicrobia bacterium]|nr:MAG: hypothetical protein C5B50_23385 [Verrucomicrobiota bacterium]
MRETFFRPLSIIAAAGLLCAAPQSHAASGNLCSTNITPSITNAPPTSFGSFPAGQYRITYIMGAVKNSDTDGWAVNDPAGPPNGFKVIFTYQGIIVTNDFPARTNAFDTQLEAEAANAGLSMVITNDGGDVSMYMDDTMDTDNTPGNPNPTFRIEPDLGRIRITQNGAEVTTIPGKSIALAQPTKPDAFPTNLWVWAIVGTNSDTSASDTNVTLGCTIDSKGQIIAGEIPGRITVRLSRSDNTNCWIEQDLQIGCTACADCEEQVGLGSVSVSISMGRTAFGHSAGFFQISQAYPSAALATPLALQYYTGSLGINDVTVTRTNGVVQKVITPQMSAIVVTNSPYQYQIIIYTNSTLTGAPKTIWTIQNPDGTSPFDRLSLTKSSAGVTNEYDYAWNATAGSWSLTTQGGARTESRYNETNGLVRTETHLIQDASTAIKYQEVNTYQTFPWGEEQVVQVIGAGSNALQTTWTFYTNWTDIGNYRQLYQTVTPGGHWKRYYYEPFTGRPIRKVTQYLDNPIPTSTTQEDANRVTTYAYSIDSDGATSEFITTLLQGSQIAWSWSHTATNYTIQTVQQTPDPAYGPSHLLTTITWKYLTPPFIGEPLKTVQWPSGPMTSYFYKLSSDGSFRTNIVSTGKPDGALQYVVDGIRTVTVLNQAGSPISEQSFDVASGLLISSKATLATDSQARPTLVQYLDGTTEQTVYGCCGVQSFTDREGIPSTYNYDPYTKQVTDVTRAGIRTHTDFDAAGNPIQTTHIGTDGSSIVQDVSIYDTAGRRISSTPADNGSGANQTVTYSEYFDSNNHRVNTTTYPDTGTRVETHYQDGSTLSVTGTAVAPAHYSYSLSTNSGKYGEVTRETKLAANGGTNEWTDTYRDSLGRAFLTIYAAAAGAPSAKTLFNDLGQQISQSDPDGLTTLLLYDPKGQAEYTITDMNTNAQVDGAGPDRITRTVSDVITDHDTTVNRTRTSVWATPGVDVSNLVSTAETSADGLQSWSIIWNNGVGTTNYQQTVYDPANQQRVVVSVTADGSSAVTTYTNGYLASVASYDSLGNQLSAIGYGHDPHGRQITVTDARTGTTTYFFNNADQVGGVLSPAPGPGQSPQNTTNFFDVMGRIWKTTLPDNTSVTNEYFVTGQLKKTYGSRTYPVQYGYDSQGRKITMTTWTNFASGQGSATTSWIYDQYRGFLTGKLYADNTGPTYTWTPAGRLQTRLWARGIWTTNTYSPAGDLLTVTYSDSTPSVTLTQDRRGRQTAITKGSQTCLLSWNDLGQELTEAWIGYPLNAVTNTTTYDQFLRRINLASSIGYPLLAIDYSYGPASRLSTVRNGAQSSVTYAYLPNSPLVRSLTFRQNGAATLATTKSWDNLNRLKGTSSGSAAGFAFAANYGYNSANQRTGWTNVDNSYWACNYDSLGQVNSGKKYWSGGTVVAGEQFEYMFDDIGNRTSTKSSGDSSGANLRVANYTNNSLNQYTSRDVPGYANILGSADSNATVTVNGQNPYRHGEFYRQELAIGNLPSAISQPVTNFASLTTTNGTLTSSNFGSLLLPQTPETFSFDADGNMLVNGLWTNAWDAENRLIGTASPASVPDAAKRKLDFTYDWQGRRTQKIVSTWAGGWAPQSTNRFVYDGWNLIGILDNTNGLLYSFTWGLDLSGSEQGAGGVGGLLSMTVHAGTNAGTYFYVFDGNGNVMGLVNSTNGVGTAQYEYGPFGEVLRATGPLAQVNPFLFSTKFCDWETGLYDYGYRYYVPITGGCLSRDRIEELGSYNLYGFAGNDLVNRADTLGLAPAALPPLTWQGPYLNSPAALGEAGASEAASLGGGLAGIGALGIALVNYDKGWLMQGIYQAMYDANGLPRPSEYPYGQEAVDRWINRNLEPDFLKQFPRDQIEENARMEEELLLLDKVVTSAKKSTDEKTCCKFDWSRFQLGGWPEHDDYAFKIFGVRMELIVTAPDGDTARYDGGFQYPKPVTVAGEVKTRRRWAYNPRGTWSGLQENIFGRDMRQFQTQERVAAKCKLQYQILFKEPRGFIGYSREAAQFAPFMDYRP